MNEKYTFATRTNEIAFDKTFLLTRIICEKNNFVF